MAINPGLFIHESDRKALKALKSVPGFTQVMKTFLSVYTESVNKLMNVSSCIRISERQLPKYDRMLKEVCDKLQMDVPELYLKLDVNPNAYTTGDTKPCIVVTSGLLETVPEELLPTVLAHECGHILCHHVLYTTMGIMIINGAVSALGLPAAILLPVQMAFMYWMRCSEYSADRVAIYYNGSGKQTAELCAHLAGFSKELNEELNMDAFLEQAEEFEGLLEDSKWNKTLELLISAGNTHPLLAIRASEGMKWANGETLRKAQAYFESGVYKGAVPLKSSLRSYTGKEYREVEYDFRKAGFSNLTLTRLTESPGFFTKRGSVVSMKINGNDAAEEDQWFSLSSPVEITYYDPYSEEEIKAMHPGQIRMEESNRQLLGKQVDRIVQKFGRAGFRNLKGCAVRDVDNAEDTMLGKIVSISINGNTQFNRGDWIDENAEIIIYYHALRKS